MFCWGNSTNHELCIESTRNLDLVIKPTFSNWEEAANIKSIATGEFHCLYLTTKGFLYSSGNNDSGQLGRTVEMIDNKYPAPVETFAGCVITDIACGTHHSMALDEWGQPFSWGSDSMGQLGTNLSMQMQSKPKIIKNLATKNIIQIACGSNHSLVLANNGDVYAWGANSFGQCGNGRLTQIESIPEKVDLLMGLPIAMIACGGDHCIVLTKSGAVFGWGKNTFGQLGVQDEKHKSKPTELNTLRNVKVCYIDCGEDFSVFLTKDGGVFTCGSGEFGQTGHGARKHESVPRKIMELMGSTVTQIACGRRHLLCRVGDRILACGYGARGQLGCPHMSFSLVPTPIPIGSADESPNLSEFFSGPTRVFAGGDHSFLIQVSEKSIPVDFRAENNLKQILTINLAKLTACEMFKDTDAVNLDLMSYMETVFASVACINASFLLPKSEHYSCRANNSGVDVKKYEEAFAIISRFENVRLRELIFYHISNNVLSQMVRSNIDAECLRIFLILPLYHEMRNPRRNPTLQGPFAAAFNKLNPELCRIVSLWWEAQSCEYFEMLVDIFKSVIVFQLKQVTEETHNNFFTSNMVEILETLAAINKINYFKPKTPKIPVNSFYIENLSSFYDVARDYVSWLNDQEGRQHHLCNYAFLFDVQCKSLLLNVDQQVQMHMAISRAATEMFSRIFIYPANYIYEPTQYFHITVSREHIVRDTVTQISNHDSSQLKKPLKVEFIGEEAEDAGGVKKEFFLLLLKEIFDPMYGMFKECEETNVLWFSSCSVEEDVMFYLIGAIFGLAIYNSIIIYVPFPLVLYKKLLNETVVLDDLAEISPTLANNLKQLLDYPDEDVEEVFNLCFAVNTEVYGEIKVNLLKENGDQIPVTHENKEEYVHLYVDFLLNSSVENQFKAFNQGFQKVCGGRIVKLFRAHELMAVVIGNQNYDWEVFENNAKYRNGYNSYDPQIRWFWEVFHELSLEDQKRFLLFLTGSDRVPVQGMQALIIQIQPVADDRYFPVAHTCFNLLDLPRYKTKERLKYCLLQAIQQTQGFSLV